MAICNSIFQFKASTFGQLASGGAVKPGSIEGHTGVAEPLVMFVSEVGGAFLLGLWAHFDIFLAYSRFLVSRSQEWRCSI